MKAYKGFDKNMQCRGFQFEEGKEYSLPEGEEAKMCEKGFHACEDPLDCLSYYAPADSVYHEVELDATDEKSDDSKRVGSRIKIGAAIDVAKIVKAHFEYVKERCDNNKQGGYYSALTGGDRSALTGGYSSALTGGYRSALTGGDSSALTGGDRSALTGGDRSALTGGYSSALTGGYSSALTGGDRSALTGGYRSALTGGYSSALTGGYSSALTGGDRSALTGGYSSVLRGGEGSKFKGGMGSVFAVEVRHKQTGELLRIETAVVDGEKIKPDTWYKYDGKKWTEADDEHL